MKLPASLSFALLWLFILAFAPESVAQPPGCTLKNPVVHIDFGRGNNVPDFNQNTPPNYNRILGSCPTDGHYTYTPATYDCFRGDWFSIAEDHTPGDKEGNMMLINASPFGGIFLSHAVSGLQGAKTYEFAVWMINVCRLDICCSSLSPSVSISLATPAGNKLASFRIGELPQRSSPQWRKFVGYFTMPAGQKSVVISMQNHTTGGCGNDFALDDITFRECVPVKPAIVKTPPPTPARQQPAQPKTTLKKEPEKKVPVMPPAAEKRTSVPVQAAPLPAQRAVPSLTVPPVLRTRANPLIKQIETEAGELVIDLYDNGQVDGDTVSVYHNNKLVVSEARLSEKPIRFRVQVDAANPQHELIMVAHNLGSIPPNTSLMVVTVNGQRYQVNISASEQKNARVIFRLKE
jgi:hypothetical protein